MADLDLSSITAAADASRRSSFTVDLGDESFEANYDLPATVIERLADLADAPIPRILSMTVELFIEADRDRFRNYVDERRLTADQLGLILEGVVKHATGKAPTKR